jgi:hypothetical protein
MTMGSVPCEVCILAPCRAGAICKIFTRVTVDARTGTRPAEHRFRSLHPVLHGAPGRPNQNCTHFRGRGSRSPSAGRVLLVYGVIAGGRERRGMRHTAGSYVQGPYLLVHQRLYRWTDGAKSGSASGDSSTDATAVSRRFCILARSAVTRSTSDTLAVRSRWSSSSRARCRRPQRRTNTHSATMPFAVDHWTGARRRAPAQGGPVLRAVVPAVAGSGHG